RILSFRHVVKQSATLLADGNELAYRIGFLFKTYCSHKFLPHADRNPEQDPERKESCSFADTRTGWRDGANHWALPTRCSFFCLKPSVPRRSFAAGPMRCPRSALVGPGPCR